MPEEKPYPQPTWKTTHAKSGVEHWTVNEPTDKAQREQEKQIRDLHTAGLFTDEERDAKLALLGERSTSEAADDLTALEAMGAFVKKYQTPVTATVTAREHLCVKLLMDGVDAEEVQKASQVPWNTLEGWVHQKDGAPKRNKKSRELEAAGKPLTGISKAALDRIGKGVEDAKKSSTTQEEDKS